MRIRRLRVHNFRSICDVEVALENLAVFVGPNNHGKSNLLAAVEFVLQPSIKLTAEDFCVFRTPGDDELWVELSFAELTTQEKHTFTKYVAADGQLTVRRRAVLVGDGVESSYHGYVWQPTEWWLQEDSVDRLTSREDVERQSHEVPALKQLLANSGRITKARVLEFQKEYIQANTGSLAFTCELEAGPLLGTKNVAAGLLPDFYLIPAVRDVADEVKTKSTSAFGRLLQRAVSEMTANDERVQAVRSQMADLIAQLNDRSVESGGTPSALAVLESAIRAEVGTWDVGIGIRVVPPELEKVFELGAELRIDDGHDTTPDRKGHGLQRALLFALVRAWAQVLRADRPETDVRPRKASDSVVFAFEEPELFLHPQAQRVLFDSLRDIASASEHQVLLCTHSTHFVSLDDYRSVIIASKKHPKAGTEIRQCTADLFAGEDAAARKNRFHMALWVNPDRAELFFARRVVLVEGETDKACLPYIASRLGCLDPTVSVIDCGSKHNLPLYISIVNAFSIPYLVVHDEDPLPDPIPGDWNETKRAEKARTFALNAALRQLVDPSLGEVLVFEPDFEGACGLSRAQGEKKGKAIAALDQLATFDDEKLPGRLVDIARNMYSRTAIPRVFPNDRIEVRAAVAE